MGASQSIQNYTLLPDDELELIILNDTSEEVSFADKGRESQFIRVIDLI